MSKLFTDINWNGLKTLIVQLLISEFENQLKNNLKNGAQI